MDEADERPADKLMGWMRDRVCKLRARYTCIHICRKISKYKNTQLLCTIHIRQKASIFENTHTHTYVCIYIERDLGVYIYSQGFILGSFSFRRPLKQKTYAKHNTTKYTVGCGSIAHYLPAPNIDYRINLKVVS